MPNKYKDTLDDLIDNSDIESLNQPESPDRPGSIDKGTRNSPSSRGASSSFLEKDCLGEDVSVIALERVPKTRDSQLYKRHNVALLGPKSRRVQYGEGQRGWEDGKDKKGRENRKGERGRGGHRKNKVNPVVGKSSSSKASVYHHIIYWFYQGLMVLGWGTGLSSRP